jgi:prepilin peptidase CpaA
LPKISDPLIVFAVAGAGASSALVDLYTRRVPNLLTFGVTVLGVTFAAVGITGLSIVSALGGFALGLALMLPGHLIGATGAGDVKLFAALGTLLGPSRTGSAFVYTALAGGVLAVVVARRRRRLRATMERTATFVSSGGSNVAEIESTSQNNRFAYAPAIALGAFAAALGL